MVPPLVLTLLAALLTPGRGAAQTTETYPFRNPRLSLDGRLSDLLGRLTLDEKISLLHQSQAAIPRLGIAYYKPGTEALHGLAWSNDINNNWNMTTANGTVFPQALGLASTWNPKLINRVGSVVADETRGFHAKNPDLWGLNVWSPVVNPLRDPRWGRNEEGYSEDPTLTSTIATAYGSGLQGDDPTYLKTAATIKHYLAYNNENARQVTDANVPARVLNEYDRQPFKSVISADAATGVMSSYNLVNGRPNTVNPDFSDVIRSWTDKELYNVTDWGSPRWLTDWQKYFPSQPEAVAAVIKAGLNEFTVDNSDSQPTITAIKEALSRGLLTEKDIDLAVRPLLSIRIRLGEFDPDGGPYSKISPDVINSPEHQKLARRTAGEAIVLLKNAKKTLPLDASKTRNLAVVGPLADTIYHDWYSGVGDYGVTPFRGIQERLGTAARVTSNEASDRIALRDVTSGKYLAATGTTNDDLVTANATSQETSAQFDVLDWGQGVVTLRNVASGRYLGYNWWRFVTRDEQPNDWFVQQQFKLEDQSDGTVVLRYAGYDTAEDPFTGPPYLTLDSEGRLMLGSATAEGAAHFKKELVIDGIASAVSAAKAADTAVVVVGNMPFINGRENHDRSTMALAERQQRLIKEVFAANPHTILVLETNYPDTITWEQQQLPGIIWTTHAGPETGHAVADVLFGDVNPAGRLTQTWYRSDKDVPADLLNYDIISSDQTYLYYRGNPLYPFGYGLSYTSFRYSNLKLNRSTVDSKGTVRVSVDVTNTGDRAGDEVVQLYTHQRASRDKTPVKALRAFERVSLAPGATKTVTLTLKAADLAHWDVTRDRWVVESSEIDLMVGASSSDLRARATLRVLGETIPARDLSKVTRAENFDGYSGIRLVDESKQRGTAVGATASGAWVKYSEAKLRNSARFTALAAKATPGDGSLQIRLDSPTGPLLGTIPVPSTGDVYKYVDIGGELAKTSGRHDVYLVFDSDLRIASFSIS